MKRRYRWLSASALALMLGALAASSEAALNSAQFDVLQQVQQQGGSMTITMHVWIKGDKARVEMDQPRAAKQLWISTGKDFYQLFPAQKTGQQRPLPTANGRPVSILDQIVGSVDQFRSTGKKVGRETIAGVPCDIYTGSLSNDPRGLSMSTKAWIGSVQNTLLLLKVEQKISAPRPNANLSGSRITTIKNLRTNISVADSQFVVPKGYNITTAPSRTGPR